MTTTDPLVAQLASLCRAEPTRARWVIVPSHAVGRALSERLARDGTDWLNLRFVTPFGLALDTAAPFLVEQGLDPLPDGLGSNLLMRLLMDLPPGTPAYFAPLADQPQMGAALWSATRELRLAGVSAATLPAAAFEDARKHGELQALLAAYERHLAERKLADTADVFRAAAAHVTASPVGAEDLVIEAPGMALPPLVRAFVDALPGEHVPGAAPVVPGLKLPRRLSDGRAEAPPYRDNAVTFPSRLACLLDPARAPKETAGQRIEMFHAAGVEAEVEGILRRVLGGTPPRPLDQVEIACASSDIAALVWEKAQRLDLPVTVESGVAAVAARPARALLGLCDWIDSGFVAGRLRRLFQSGDLVIDLPDGAGSGQAARLLLEAEATWDRSTYDQSLTALAARREAAAADRTEELDAEGRAAAKLKAARALALRDWIREALALIPQPDADGSVALSALLRGLSSLVETRMAAPTPFDAVAAAALTQALGDLLAIGDLRRPMRQSVAFVRDAVARLSIGASRARPGHLHVSSLAAAGYTGRPFTFVAGLREGGVFPALVEDPVLLDAERVRIDASLATSHDRLEESVHAVLSRLAVLPAAADPDAGGVCLSYSCRDLDDGRETFPSWLMLRALRLVKNDAALNYDHLREALGTPETLVPPDGQALSDGGWWLGEGRRAAEAGEPAVLTAYPSLAAGRQAAAARASDGFTEWDGLVPAARDALDPRVTGEPVSTTPVESLARCPFRYFLERGLGLDVVEDDDPDRDQWLDPLQRGAALHRIYRTLGREARTRGHRLHPTRDLAFARTLAAEVLSDLRAECPPPSEVVFDLERAEFVRDVELFLEFEAEREPSEPIAFEVGFGRPPDGEEPLASADPVSLALGEGRRILLRGIIDRIDKLGDGSYEVIDYKTGGYWRDKWQGTFAGGTMLQHAVYGLAAASLLTAREPRPRIARGTYEFPSARGGGERRAIPPPSRAALVTVLSDLCDVVADGAFIASPDDAECRYCDFAKACGRPTDRSAAKIAEEANTNLDAYRRLKSHE
jgi:ATP-dependent helicase/nuclease subunit B